MRIPHAPSRLLPLIRSANAIESDSISSAAAVPPGLLTNAKGVATPPDTRLTPPPPRGGHDGSCIGKIGLNSACRKPPGCPSDTVIHNLFFAIWLVSLCILYLACTESCLDDCILYPCVSGCICAHMAAAAAVYLPVSGLLLACNQP
jgi:hypothetical protein